MGYISKCDTDIKSERPHFWISCGNIYLEHCTLLHVKVLNYYHDALEMVIYNAKAAGDQAIVAALTEFKWEVELPEEAVDAVSVQPAAKPSFPPPPDVESSGRSDY